MDFKHLTRDLEVPPESTREYVFAQIVGEPSLIVGPADDSNPIYQEARLRYVIEQSEAAAAKPRGSGQSKPTIEQLKKVGEENRETDMRLVAEGCIRSWGKAPVDPEGNEVEFTPENALDFLKALPDYIYTPFSNFVANVQNFTVKALDAAKLGNS